MALHPGEPANFLQISPLYRQSILGECQVKNGLIVNGDNVTIVSICLFELAMLLGSNIQRNSCVLNSLV